MRKFQIEKVEHGAIYNDHTCCSVDYFPKSDKVLQVNYVSENNSRLYACERTVGIWRIKSLKIYGRRTKSFYCVV